MAKLSLSQEERVTASSSFYNQHFISKLEDLPEGVKSKKKGTHDCNHGEIDTKYYVFLQYYI